MGATLFVQPMDLIKNRMQLSGVGGAAKEHKKPFYVAAESFKFARLFPLNQSDLPDIGENIREKLNFVDTACWIATAGTIGRPPEEGKEGIDSLKVSSSTPTAIPGLVKIPQQVKVDNPLCDYTPAKYITLLFTDLGVLTPSAVSDELIKLYQ